MKTILKKILLHLRYVLKKISLEEKNYLEYFFFKKGKLNKLRKKYPNCHLFELENFKRLLESHSKKIFNSLEDYQKKKTNWVDKKKNFDLIPNNVFLGSIGNYSSLYTLLLANKAKLRKEKKIRCFIPKNSKINNTALASYFKNYVQVLKKKESIWSLKKQIPLGVILELENKSVRIDEARNFINQKLNRKKPLFKISKKHETIGNSFFKQIGFRSTDWFVTLHLRQFGWRGEKINNSKEFHRTPKPENYISAIKEISSLGGKVFLVGNNNFNFPRIKNFYNYSDSPFASYALDVYLAAKAKFCIANSSGFYPIAKYFGTPVLLTDGPSHTDYLNLTEEDMYLPRIIFNKKSNRKKLELKIFEYPLNSLYSDTHFKKLNLGYKENTPNDILQATVEMIKKPKKSYLQKKFKKELLKVFKKYNYVPYANLPNAFLKKNY